MAIVDFLCTSIKIPRKSHASSNQLPKAALHRWSYKKLFKECAAKLQENTHAEVQSQ